MQDTVKDYEERQGEKFNSYMLGVIFIIMGLTFMVFAPSLGIVLILFGIFSIFVLKKFHKWQESKYRYR